MKNVDRPVFIFANDVLNIVYEKKPSRFIPFKGNFPLCPVWREDDYWAEITSGKLFKDVPEWCQDIINKGLKIKAMEDGFIKYLKDNALFQQFPKMSSADKTTELVRFMNANSLTFEYLNID